MRAGCAYAHVLGLAVVELIIIVAFVLLYWLLRSPGTVLLLAVLGAALVAG